MDFLHQLKQLNEAAKELERNRNDRTKFMKEYWKYALSEAKKSKNNDEIWLYSPQSRRKKLGLSEKHKNIIENDEKEGSTRKGRTAAKKALESICASNKLLEVRKLRRPTDFEEKSVDKRRKRFLDNEDIDAPIAKSLKKSEEYNEKSSISPSGNEEDPCKYEDEQTLKVTEDGACTAESEPQDDCKEKSEKTLVSSGMDMFDSSGIKSNTSARKSYKISPKCVLEDKKLAMSPVIALERISLDQINHLLGNQDNSEIKEEICSEVPGENLIEKCKSRTFILPKNSSNPEEDPDNPTCSDESSNKKRENKTAKHLTSKTSSELWIEELLFKQEQKEGQISENGEKRVGRRGRKNAAKEESTKERSTRKATDCILAESNTRSGTRVKEIVEMLENEGLKNDSPSSKKERTEKSKKIIQCSEDYKENATPMLHSLRGIDSSESKGSKGKPLSNRNRIYTPIVGKQQPSSAVKVSASKTVNKIAVLEAEKKKKENEIKRRKQKEEEALKNKEELMKAKSEELKRKREHKLQKVFATREAVQKEKTETLAKLEKEKLERDRAIKAEAEKAKEQLLRKKQINLQKAQEAEERRIREENARVARLKEQEEEQKRLAEIKMKQQEEAEKLQQQRRHEEEKRAKEGSKTRKAGQEKSQNKNQTDDSNSYDITPHKIDREPLPLKDEDNYDIDDLRIEDSEDEDNPRKVIPRWARKSERAFTLKLQTFLPENLISTYFVCPSKTPDLKEFFGKAVRERIRTSSAVWRTPPRLDNEK